MFIENFGHESKWLAGTIEEIRGPLTYMVRLSEGRVLKRHVDYIQKQTSMEPSNAQDVIPSHKESLSFRPLLDTEEPQPEQLSLLYQVVLLLASGDHQTGSILIPELKGRNVVTDCVAINSNIHVIVF